MIISFNQGGLCNRIKAWVSVQRYSHEFNCEYKIAWKIIDSYQINKHLFNCKFSDLFQNNCELKNSKINNYILHKNPDFLIFDSDNLPNNFSKFESNCKKKFIPSDKLKRNIDFEYLQIPDNVIQNYLPFFQNIKPINEIKQKILDFSKNFNSQTISLHIRSWSLPNEQERQSLFNIDKIKNKLKEFKNYQIFLVTDNSKNKELLSEFNIITYPRLSQIDRNSTLGIQEDLIELFLLSKNKTMILSHFSTYSEVAWWFGGCSTNIFIIK